MNKNIRTIVATAALVLMTGCVTAGTWVNGYYIDGPLCTVCDGMRVVQHAYGTTVCAHCDGTGIEPPEAPVVIENVVYDTVCLPPPPPPPPRYHHPARPIIHHNAPHHGGGRHMARPAPARPAGGGHKIGGARPAAPHGGNAGRRAPAPRGGGHGGGHRARR